MPLVVWRRSRSQEAAAARSRKLLRIYGDNLRKARTAAGLTQQEVSERSGLPLSVVKAAEKGRENLSSATMVGLAYAVGKDFVEMFVPAVGTSSPRRPRPAQVALRASVDDPNDDLRAFAANLKEARRNAGMSWKELAVVADVSLAYIAQIERGEGNATVKVLKRLANALGVSIEQLLRSRETSTEKN